VQLDNVAAGRWLQDAAKTRGAEVEPAPLLLEIGLLVGRNRSPIMSWHGPFTPLVEGIATKSHVVASGASKLASTASRIFCLGSMAFIALLFPLSLFPLPLSESRARQYTPRPDCARMETRMPGNRNILYLIIGALTVAVTVLGYNLYQLKKEPEGLQINVGPSGLKIQNK
jgi:hypothetical protein